MIARHGIKVYEFNGLSLRTLTFATPFAAKEWLRGCGLQIVKATEFVRRFGVVLG